MVKAYSHQKLQCGDTFLNDVLKFLLVSKIEYEIAYIVIYSVNMVNICCGIQ